MMNVWFIRIRCYFVGKNLCCKRPLIESGSLYICTQKRQGLWALGVKILFIYITRVHEN